MFLWVNAGTVCDWLSADLRYFASYTEDDYPIHQQFMCQEYDKSHIALFGTQTCYVMWCYVDACWNRNLDKQFGRMWDLRFSRHWFWRFMSSGTDVMFSKQITFIFRVSLSCISWPWRWRRYDPLKCLELSVYQHNVKRHIHSQLNWAILLCDIPDGNTD
jgi:hypothetical protein